MKLATRTGLASLGASVLAIVVLSNVVTTQFERVLRDRVDEQLSVRAESSAAILVAVGDRISVSELNGVIDPARILSETSTDETNTDETRTVEIGARPPAGLPPVGPVGLRTVEVGGESWRLLGVEVIDVPTAGDRAVVEFSEPLGVVQDRVAEIRRRTFTAGLLAAVGAGVVGWLFGRRAARPLTRLQQDAAAIGTAATTPLAVSDRYGTPEVDDVAAALNASLSDLGGAIERREEALAAARDFAGSATHELRTPLQSAMTNLDVALAEPTPDGDRESISRARAELSRMAGSLAAVQALSQADLAPPGWFEPLDLAAVGDLVDEVTSRVAGAATATVDLRVDGDGGPWTVWSDGVRLAADNVLRNALTHGRPADGSPGRIVVTVTAEPLAVLVDDDGPGVAAADRARVVAPFERAATTTPGSGLGLAVADRVARAHGGGVHVSASPSGGTRVRIALGPPVDGGRSLSDPR